MIISLNIHGLHATCLVSESVENGLALCSVNISSEHRGPVWPLLAMDGHVFIKTSRVMYYSTVSLTDSRKSD